MSKDLLIIQKTLSIIPSYRSENVAEYCGVSLKGEKREVIIEKLLQIARTDEDMLERILKATTIQFSRELAYDPNLILRHARIHPRWFCDSGYDCVMLKKNRKDLKPVVEARIAEALLPIKRVLVDDLDEYNEKNYVLL